MPNEQDIRTPTFICALGTTHWRYGCQPTTRLPQAFVTKDLYYSNISGVEAKLWIFSKLNFLYRTAGTNTGQAFIMKLPIKRIEHGRI